MGPNRKLLMALTPSGDFHSFSSHRLNCGLIAFLLQFWLRPYPSSGVSSSASSPFCMCGSSGRSCGSSRRSLPSSNASGSFFSTQQSPRSVTPSAASSGQLRGLFSLPEICHDCLSSDNPVQKEDLTVKPPETDYCVNV